MTDVHLQSLSTDIIHKPQICEPIENENGTVVSLIAKNMELLFEQQKIWCGSGV